MYVTHTTKYTKNITIEAESKCEPQKQSFPCFIYGYYLIKN